MAVTSHRRLVNPMLGTYFGIFTSCMAAVVLMALVLERLGVAENVLRMVMLGVPIALYMAVGLAAACKQPGDFFAAGRRVPSVYTGLILAGSALGATGIVCMSGLFFINGFDAWCIAIGVWAGFVVMALLVAPYLRKHGAYTLPSYLGRRLDNRAIRVVAATVLLVPTVLVAAAELKLGAYAAGWLSGWQTGLMAQLLVFTLLPVLAAGGMRSLTWMNAGQAIVALIALVVPVAIVAAIETNLPLPQLSHGPVLRGIGRQEALQAIPIPIAPSLGFDLAGLTLQSLASRVAHPYTSVGPSAFILMVLSTACAIATAPWLLPRVACTPGVYETRKSAAWAIVFAGLALVTAASIAVFLRDMFLDQVVGRSPREVPNWFRELVDLGVAGVRAQVDRLSLADIGFKRDAAVFALPIAAGFSSVVTAMALAGAVAAALLAASAAIGAIGNMLAEDGVGAMVWSPASGTRVLVGRLTLPIAAIITGWIAIFVPADPLDLLLWAFALSASAAFPVVVLSVLWKRLNALGACAAMITGFVTALLAITAGEVAWLGMPSALAAVFGVPAGFLAAAIATRLGSLPDRNVLALVRDMRLPGGETICDREERLQRLKQQRSA